MQRLYYCLFLLVTVFVPESRAEHTANEVVAELISRANDAQNTNSTYECDVIVSSNGKNKSSSRWRVNKRDGMCLAHNLTNDMIICKNKEYVFSIKKNKTGEWILVKHHSYDIDNKFWSEIGRARPLINYLTACGDEYDAVEIVKNNSASFFPIAPSSPNDSRYSFSYTSDKETPSHNAKQKFAGEIHFVKDARAVISKYSHTTKGDVSVAVDVVRESASPESNIPLKSILCTVSTVDQRPFAMSTSYTFFDSSENASVAEYYLEFYNLSISNSSSIISRSKVIWFVTFFVAMLALVTILKRMRKRRFS
jgi:hypothetical protein